MSEYIKRIRTTDGDKQIDYESLANLPTLVEVDDTLTQSGKAADAKVVGDTITEVNESIINATNAVIQTSNAKYANMLKGHAEGQVINVTDVLADEHELNVTINSKNLIPFPYTSKDTLELDGVTYAVDTDGKITLSGVNDKGTNWYLARNFNLKKGAYVFSYSGNLSGINVLFYCPSKQFLLAGLTEYENTVPFIIDEMMPDCNIYINIDRGGTTVNGTFYVQLEAGNTKTEYTPYVDPSTTTLTYGEMTYAPNSDGSVDGLISTYPTMEMSVPDGFKVRVEYNRDITKAIDKLTSAIEALGGTV